ncbi:MAG: hypothetical protein ACFFDF_00880 [Candidatus Odinarchaeota archaeon]
MNRIENIVYPPLEIFNPDNGKADYEYIILWMLNNNEICTWADFMVKMSGSTIHGYLKNLINGGYIIRPEKGIYQITSRGRERFNDIVYDNKLKKRTLKFPPKTILKKRNYDHWILWMLYNNYTCRWSDFKKDPLLINQSALSNTLNSLIDKNLVTKNKQDYMITSSGKIEYFNALKLYDLDRQSLLEQESKRIEEITGKTSNFFDRYNISNDKLKFRFIDYVLNLNYSKVELILKDEEIFNKILLFLTINHPDQYPNYISPEEFSETYEIKIEILNYYILEIVEKQFFSLKFFKIEDMHGSVYYFRKNEPIEKMLGVIVEKYIIQNTYLNKLQKKPKIDIELLLDNILSEICGTLFHEDLRFSLRKFIPEYIKYLAYKIESGNELINKGTKLEDLLWQSIFEEFEAFKPLRAPIFEGKPEFSYTLDHQIFDVLEIVYFSKLKFLNTNECLKALNLQKVQIFDQISKLLYRNKVSKARDLYEKSQENLEELHQLIINDVISTSEYNYIKSIEYTKQIIAKFPDSFVGYLLQSLTYFLLDDYDKSLDLVEKGLKQKEHISLICQKAQIFIKTFRRDEILEKINDLLLKHPNDIRLLRVKYLLKIVNRDIHAEITNDVLGIINSAIKIDPNDKELLILKSLYYFINQKYKEGKEFLIKEININIFKKNPKIDIPTLFLMTFSYTARGKFEKAMKITNQAEEIYPNHPISFLAKAILLGYNLIFKFKPKVADISTFQELVDKALSLEKFKYNKVKYLLLRALVLNELKLYDDAFNAIDNAIDLIPNFYRLYIKKIGWTITAGRNLKALELIDDIIDKIPYSKNVLYNQKAFVLSTLKRYDESLEIYNEQLHQNPKNLVMVNNKTLQLAYLGRKKEAIETAEYLINLDPSRSNFYDTFGEVYMLFGEYENAINKFEEALKIESTGNYKFLTYVKLGFCYQELKLFKKALEYFEKGKLLTDRMIPSEREIYFPQIEKFLLDLKKSKNKLKKE